MNAQASQVTKSAANFEVGSMSSLSKQDKDNIKRSDRYRVNPRLLVISSGLNMRMQGSPESRAHIDSIKATIVAYITKNDPENRVWEGDLLDVFQELKVVVGEDGMLHVYDGYHRAAAIIELIAEGYDIHFIHVDGRQVSALEMRYAMLRSSLAMPHTPLERAIEFANLQDNFGQTTSQIAALSGNVTLQRVEQLLLLGHAPREVHEMVFNKQITADGAIEILRKHRDDPDAAVAAIKAVVDAKDGNRPVGRAVTRPSLSKNSQDRLFAALSNGNKKLLKSLDQIKAEHGDEWEAAPVTVELPAAVVAEVLERMKKAA